MKTINTEVTPSDTDLEKRLRIFLDQRNLPSLRRVRVSADNGVIRLRGRVRSFHEKQLCLSCCRHVAGVVGVVDQIIVEDQAVASPHNRSPR